MTDSLLALIPQYGLWIVLFVISIGGLGIPLPASMLAMASGGFVASEDLALWQVLSTCVGSYMLGDQAAFTLARFKGPAILGRFKSRKRSAKIITKAEALFERWGGAAIFLSRTIISPLGPYTAYIAGATEFNWLKFTAVAIIGAVCWTGIYVSIGYFFASQMTDLSGMISNMLGLLVALVIAIGSGIWLHRSWKKYKMLEASKRETAQ